jgi:hypothetical protein
MDVSEQDAIEMTRKLAKVEGVFGGMSSGGGISASIRLANELEEGLIVCTFPIGMMMRDEKLIISYGDNDSCVKIMETTLEEMKKTMMPVKNVSTSVKFNQSDNMSENVPML